MNLRPILTLAVILAVGSCRSMPSGCITAAEPFTLAGTIESRPFTRAVFLNSYHVSTIAPDERLMSEDAEGPVNAAVSLTQACNSQRRLATQLRRARLSRISGWGHYDTEYGVFIVDCICSVQPLSEPTADQTRRLMVP